MASLPLCLSATSQARFRVASVTCITMIMVYGEAPGYHRYPGYAGCYPSCDSLEPSVSRAHIGSHRTPGNSTYQSAGNAPQ